VDAKLYDALSRVGLANKETNGLSRGNHAHSDSTLHSEGSHEEEKESPWEVVATLHSHLDGVRSARICQGVLLTAGEDSSVKAWDIGALPMRCDAPCEDMEPFANYRAHSGPVHALAVPDREDGHHFPAVGFSGGIDGDIYAFELISPSDNPPDNRQTRQMGHLQRFRAHRDAVLSLDLQPKLGILASAGSDKLVLLWRVVKDGSLAWHSGAADAKALNIPPPHGSDQSHTFGPLTGVAWGPRNKESLLLCSSSSASTCCAMDVERGVAIYGAQVYTREEQLAPVVAIASHAMNDMAVSGHADSCARVFSPQTGRQMWNLQCGQGNVVTSVALDPFGSGFEVVTTGHDGTLRIFDLRNCNCVQEIPLHAASGQGDAIHCAGFLDVAA